MARKSFFDLFPPPNFLRMPAAGLSIGEDAIRFVHLKARASGNGLALADFAEEKLPAGSIVDGIPVAEKKDQIISALKKLKHSHRISFVNVGLPEDKAYVFKATVSVPAGANLADSVGFILEENIPISPAETVFDFSVLDEGVGMRQGAAASAEQGASTGDPSIEVVVCAFPQETVEVYLEICKAAGLAPLRFDIESSAAARAVVAAGDTRTHLLVRFVGEKVVLTIVSSGVVQFVSIINPNADTSARSLGVRAREKLADSVELITLCDEIKKVCLYWQSERVARAKSANKKVESIIICGDVSEKNDLAAYLSKNIGIPASLAEVWQNAFSTDKTIPGITAKDSLRFAGAAGLAIAGASKFSGAEKIINQNV